VRGYNKGAGQREIVIVDDHEAVLDALLGMVEEAGYEAVAFSNTTAALIRRAF
jgi:FixJ family two-component response regulator